MNAPPHPYRAPVWIIFLRVLFTVFTILTIVFIFSNSAEIGAVSGGKSKLVTEWLNSIMSTIGISFRFSEHLVRKLAHFAEYALLGFWLMLTLRIYTRRVISHITYPLFLGLLVPVLDEFYQTYIPGRAGMVRDVLIDFAGVCAGICCGLFVLLLVRMFTVLRKSGTQL